MKINLSNYEIYFLDYLDGKLSVDQVDEFLDFLKNHPELEEELKSLNEFKLPAEEISFEEKDNLFKEEENNSFNYRAVAFMEGTLSEKDQKDFVEEINADSNKEKEFDLILSTKLKPEEVQYPYKEKLYRKEKIKLLYWAYRAAAVLLLLFAIWAVTQQKPSDELNPVYTESITPALKAEKDDAFQKQRQIKREKELEKIKKTVKDSIPKKTKSIREKTKGRLKEVVSISPQLRTPAPQSLRPIVASLEPNSDLSTLALEEINTNVDFSQSEYLTLKQFLAKKILKKEKNKPVNLDEIAKGGLKAFSDISNDKIAYETAANGKVSEISLNTRLLAFSIPITKKQ